MSRGNQAKKKPVSNHAPHKAHPITPHKTPHRVEVVIPERTPLAAMESTSLDGLTLDGEPISTQNSTFQAELDYDGYKNIVEYDNDEYSADVAGVPDDLTAPLNFKWREEEQSIAAEENVLDKQEHSKERS